MATGSYLTPNYSRSQSEIQGDLHKMSLNMSTKVAKNSLNLEGISLKSIKTKKVIKEYFSNSEPAPLNSSGGSPSRPSPPHIGKPPISTRLPRPHSLSTGADKELGGSSDLASNSDLCPTSGGYISSSHIFTECASVTILGSSTLYSNCIGEPQHKKEYIS
ncbi:hypothetical protein TNCV_4814301 [Trichonephila clavipes]|nr:hypothetical protein TNCV_4814301 [Trichonephila clavipes]